MSNKRLKLQSVKLIELPSIIFLDYIKKRKLETHFIYPIKDIGVIEIHYKQKEFIHS